MGNRNSYKNRTLKKNPLHVPPVKVNELTADDLLLKKKEKQESDKKLTYDYIISKSSFIMHLLSKNPTETIQWTEPYYCQFSMYGRSGIRKILDGLEEDLNKNSLNAYIHLSQSEYHYNLEAELLDITNNPEYQQKLRII
jgi:hypothetical protein